MLVESSFASLLASYFAIETIITEAIVLVAIEDFELEHQSFTNE